MNNERNMLERVTSEKLRNLIDKDNNFIDKDTLLENLFKYCRTEYTMKSYNTRENTEIYRRMEIFDLNRTYIWDGRGSLDDLIEGWIPKEMLEIFFLHQKKRNKQTIRKLILNLARSVNEIIYNTFWKNRNEAINTWEKNNGINFLEKRNKKRGNKKVANERLKRKISGKKNNYEHVVDEGRYLNVARRIGLGFPGSLDKRVGILLLHIKYWFTISLDKIF